jgi:23S rRNA (adenine2503-C2)-methyltransferase
MEILEKIYSKVDKTIKYIFRLEDGLIIEFSYINKDDGKDIICAPTQTSCYQGCKFCHITDVCTKLEYRDLESKEMFGGIEYIYQDLSLKDHYRTLLVSFMGCGEPVINPKKLISAMCMIGDKFDKTSPVVRFAIATSMPKHSWENFFILTHDIKRIGLPVKMHLSLHYTMDSIRTQWMPNALDIIPAIVALEFYKKLTGNSVEIHYALIEGINDTEQDAILLSELIKTRDIPVKFLFFNEKEAMEYKASSKDKLNNFRRYFDKYSIKHEYYIPPGLDVGASCGQFLLDYYIKYNSKG